jgi:hypothetical protein
MRLFVLIWVRPRPALEAVAAGPDWVWAVPLGAAALLLYVRFLIFIAIMETSAALPILAGGLVGITLGWLLRAIILWKTSAALGGRSTFAVIYRLSAWAAFPLILREVVQTAYTLATGTLPAGEGLASLMSQPGHTLAPAVWVAILSRVDLFALWFLALLFLAVRVGTSLTRTRAALVVVCYGVLALLPVIANTLLGVLFG